MKQAQRLVVTTLTKRFGDIDAVRDVSFKAAAGEVIGFVGPNGAGKTTTLSMLMGFLRPDKGTIKINGANISPESAHTMHASCGFVSGDMVLPGELTGSQYLSFMAARNGRIETDYDKAVAQLKPVLNRPINELSRGNKQKIALIGALQHRPDVLLLDEPTSGLDPIMQDTFLAIIKREAERGATVMMSSHILTEVASASSRIMFMRSGKIILDQQMQDIAQQIGKHVIISSPQASKLAKFAPEYCSVLSHDAHTVDIKIDTQHVSEFMRWLVTKPFVDISIADRSLDDVFHELYKGDI